MIPMNTKITHTYGNNLVHVYDSAAVLKEAATELIAQQAVEMVARQSRFSLALSGGSTPVGVYQGLISDKWLKRFPWEQTQFVFGDERYVPPDDAMSNYKMAMDAFLQAAPVSDADIYPVPTDCEHPDDCAEIYERTLREALQTEDNSEIPVIDLVLLGMGDDGHTASLFPDTEILTESASAVAAVYVDKLDSWRISLTFPTINNASQVVVLVAGENKAAVLREVFTTQTKKYPIQSLDNPNGVVWLVDQSAASQLG